MKKLVYFLQNAFFSEGRRKKQLVTILSIQPLLFWPTTGFANEFLALSLEELVDVEVTSVSKRAQTLTSSAAAIYAVDSEEIRRSGATSLPELLKLVPGMQVAQIDANKWAVSARGHNSRFANKLLVLIDGRSVYTPTFSGVYWDSNDTLIEDIERVEIIRGPGAALWGANAVNGVINIITKHANSTDGSQWIARVANDAGYESSFRYARELDENTNYRVYAKYKDIQESELPSSDDASDEWDIQRVGFRLDRNGTKESSEKPHLMVLGDLYELGADQLMLELDPISPEFDTFQPSRAKAKGGSLLAKYEVTTESETELSLQAYYDYASREEKFHDEDWRVYDVSAQVSFEWFENYVLTTGGGYRFQQHDTRPKTTLEFIPPDSDIELSNFFFQNHSVFGSGRGNLYVGAKWEHHELSPEEFEFLPNIRASWQLNDQNMFWASISKAIRTPSRVEQEGRLTLASIPEGLPGLPPLPVSVVAIQFGEMESEELVAYEFGLRSTQFNNFYLDIAAFYHEYENTRAFSPEAFPSQVPNPPAVPQYFELGGQLDNAGGDDYSRGIEIAVEYELSDNWKLKGNYSYIDQTLEYDPAIVADLTSAPAKNIANLQSWYVIDDNMTLDFWIRYVDELSGTDIDSYWTLNINFEYQINESINFSLMAKNLGDEHQEFEPEVVPIQTTYVTPTLIGEFSLSF